MSSIFLAAGVEEATNPATFILAKECSARFEQETFLKTKILANFKMQLNRSILRKEICSVVIISEIIYSKIAKVFQTLLYLVYWKPKHSALLSSCGLAVDHYSIENIVNQNQLTMFQRKSRSSCLQLQIFYVGLGEELRVFKTLQGKESLASVSFRDRKLEKSYKSVIMVFAARKLLEIAAVKSNTMSHCFFRLTQQS